MRNMATGRKKDRKARRQNFSQTSQRGSLSSGPDPKKIIWHGKVVFKVFWDSGAPGAGADYELVFKWRDSYAVQLSFDEPKGPYNSLAAAVKATELYRVTRATVSIDSEELSSEEIAKILRYTDEPPFGLSINGEAWIFNREKKFVRKVDEDQP